ncbi:unnamed protein product [Linum tenue]|uniref:Uncharacterized protein n=1 Tax=Linum tenue TaxID=586396 RepID=A0AAV0MBP6_9ROSI|nr:unnamed protein product [Linum tenue]
MVSRRFFPLALEPSSKSLSQSSSFIREWKKLPPSTTSLPPTLSKSITRTKRNYSINRKSSMKLKQRFSRHNGEITGEIDARGRSPERVAREEAKINDASGYCVARHI